jgi:serine/threonine protein kinase
MALQLLVVLGPDMGKTFSFGNEQLLVIGRGEDCAIRLDDSRVSRNHCQITIEGGRAVLQDLNSSWGTMVNGQKISTHHLQPNDVIELSETKMRFEVGVDAAAVTWAPDVPQESAPTVQPNEHPIAAPAPIAIPKPQTTPQTAAQRDVQPSQSTAQDTTPPAGLAAPSKQADQQDKQGGPFDGLIGQTIHRYRIDAALAQEKTGMVFRATDIKKGRTVALKVMNPEFAQQEEDVQRFIRAVGTMKDVKHPNLVALYGAGLNSPYCWLASEFVEGSSLDEILKNGRMPWHLAARMGLEIASALCVAADQNVVHRNITPASILIRKSDGTAKLGDLILAKALEGTGGERLTKAGETVGDLPFLSPESMLDEPLDARSDLYSLGITVYTAASGSNPFVGRTLSETILNAQTKSPPSLRTIDSGIPVRFENILFRMMARNRDERYAHPNEAVRDLTDLLKSVQQAAPPAAAAQPASNMVQETDQTTQPGPVPPVAVQQPTLQPVQIEPPQQIQAPVAPLAPQIQAVTSEEQPPAFQTPVINTAPTAPVVPIASPVAPTPQPVAMSYQQRKAAKKRKNAIIMSSVGGALALVAVIGFSMGWFGGPGETKEKTVAKANGGKSNNSKQSDDSTDNERRNSNAPVDLPTLIKQVERSVVRVNVIGRDGESTGSGFVVHKKGVITNWHVIQGATSATVVFVDGLEAKVEGVWATDDEYDLAYMKIDTPRDLVPIALAHEMPEKGTRVLAFGAPLGLDFSASEGIVSGVRSVEELEKLGVNGIQGTWIQTTAPISPGNSGGPLVNMKGEVVAANTMMLLAGQNLNFAISAEDVHRVMQMQGLTVTTLADLSTKYRGSTDSDDRGQPTFMRILEMLEPDAAMLERINVRASRSKRTISDSGRSEDYDEQRDRWNWYTLRDYDKLGNHDIAWHDDVLLIFDAEKNRGKTAVPLDKILASRRRIAEANCDDPIVLARLAYIPTSSDAATNRKESFRLATKAVESLPQSNYPPRVDYVVRRVQFDLASRLEEFDDFEKLQAEELKIILKVFADKLMSDDQRRMFSDTITGDFSERFLSEQNFEMLDLLKGRTDLDEWMHSMLAGHLHFTIGWRRRGGGSITSVTDQERRDFKVHLNEARVHYLRAWEAEPTFPEAAAMLLKITMAIGPVADEDTRFWFDEAVAAQFSYTPVYSAFRWSLRPRWGGSHEELLRLGEECLATGQFDSKVPIEFHQAVQDVVSELDEDDPSPFSRPDIVEKYKRLFSGYRAKATDVQSKNFVDSQLLCVLILAKRFEEARTLHDKLGKAVDTGAFELFDLDMEAALDSL